MKKLPKLWVLSTVLLIGFGSGVAFAAGELDGIVGYYGPQHGFSYWNQSSILTTNTGSHEAIGKTAVKVTAGGYAPGGYIGINANTYDNGLICRSTGFNYNQSGTTYFEWYTSTQSCNFGHSYTSAGYTKAYTYSNTWNTYTSHTAGPQTN